MKEGLKLDNGKLDWSLLPFETLEGVVEVLQFGEKKYTRDNWKLVENAENRYFSALLRHIFRHKAGEKKDIESGLSHLDHAIANLIFLKYFELKKIEGSEIK